MLFTEAQLNSSNPMAILDEAVYLDESEALINPATVPVREMSRLGEGVTIVRFDDIAALAESHGANYIDAIAAVAEASGVDPELMAVAVDEADIIENPDIVLELSNVVVVPISSEDPVYQFCENCLNQYAETGDESFLEAVLNEKFWSDPDDSFRGGLTKKAVVNNIKAIPSDLKFGVKHSYDLVKKGKVGHALKSELKTPTAFKVSAALDSVAGLNAPARLLATADGVQTLFRSFKNRPRNFISRKIAALRQMYDRWLTRANTEKKHGTAGIFNTICANILTLIDKLLAVLQKGANKLG